MGVFEEGGREGGRLVKKKLVCYVLKIGFCWVYGNKYFMRMVCMGKLMKKYCKVVINLFKFV